MRGRMMLVGLLLGFAAPAAAQSGLPFSLAPPLELTVEARVGPYVPDTDVYRGFNAIDLSGGASAFNCSFGFGVRPIVFVSPQLSVFDLFGTVLLGVEGGFYNVSGRQLTDPNDCSSGRALDRNELTVLPLLMTATYRFDWALDRFGFPLVPYARLGVGGAGYILTENGQLQTTNEYEAVVDGTTVKQRRDPLGFSFGGKAAVGLMFALDILEPLRALRARAKGVYEHTYLFGEVAFFDAGWAQNEILARAPASLQSYWGPTLIVGAERLPLVTAGFAVAF